MRKIGANKIFTGIKERPWINGGIVYFDDDGTVWELSEDNALGREHAGVEYYSGILTPGLVNAHLHLELSWLHGKFDRFDGLGDFAGRMASVHDIEMPGEEKLRKAVYFDSVMAAGGVVLAADIVNINLTVPLKSKSDVEYVNFIEVFGLSLVVAGQKIRQAKALYDDFAASGLDVHFAVHSTYSVSLELYEKLRELVSNETVSTIHFLEGKKEKELLDNVKHNGFSAVLKEFSDRLPYELWSKGPAGYLKGLFDAGTSLLLVHNTFSDIETVKSVKREFPQAYFVLCPSSNIAVEGSLPAGEIFRGYGDFVLIGTDSAATNRTNMSLAGEMNILLEHGWELEELLFAVTLNGAMALGHIDKYGSFEPGKKPGAVLMGIKNKEIVYSKRIV